MINSVQHLEKEFNGQLEENIDISSLSKGTYIIQILDSNKSIIDKITIE